MCAYLLLLYAISESTQLITMLCSSAAAWEGADTRNSFCSYTGEIKSIHQTVIVFGPVIVKQLRYKAIIVLMKGMMSSTWLTAINTKTTRWTTWMLSPESPTFSTSSRETQVRWWHTIKHKNLSIQLVNCNPSLWKPKDPKLILKDVIYTLTEAAIFTQHCFALKQQKCFVDYENSPDFPSASE